MLHSVHRAEFADPLYYRYVCCGTTELWNEMDIKSLSKQLVVISCPCHFSLFALSVKLTVCRKQKRCHCNWHGSFQNLHVTQISSHQRWDRCPINTSSKKQMSFFFYYWHSTCKSFLFISTCQIKSGWLSVRIRLTFISVAQFPFTVTNQSQRRKTLDSSQLYSALKCFFFN